jgi:adenine-specific DNA-methyltransferase
LSRLTELIARVDQRDPELARELSSQFQTLLDRREFGLNFERHVPEGVHLPGRPIRRGDKVRWLPDRTSPSEPVDKRLWLVTRVRNVDGTRIASLLEFEARGGPEQATRPVDDLVVVTTFRDPVYPGLRSTGRVTQGGDKPFHSIINAENFHALEAFRFAYEHKIDAIYIDPPYNTRDKDWKYNNDYVDTDDAYRHSKWLAFMERRLRLAKSLLNPKRSVLIVTIDENEVHRLALLIRQVFNNTKTQMVTSVINPRGHYRAGEFARCDEYLFFVTFGSAQVAGERDEDYSEGASVSWRTLRRSDITSKRGTSKGGKSQFYPIYVNDMTRRIAGIGEPLPPGVARTAAPRRRGCTAVFPLRDDGTEMNWGLTPDTLQDLLEQGFVRIGRRTTEKPQQYEVSYLTSGRVDDIKTGRAKVVGHDETGAVIAKYVTHKLRMPLSTWAKPSHNAETGGTNLLKLLLGEKGFPYPKSLYAVEDALHFFIGDKPDALVLDFFAGSGTTAHAVMRLNHRDGGKRQSISVANNEVSAAEAAALRASGFRPGDPDWESWGICNYVTTPRVKAAITGKTADGRPIQGVYKYNDEFAIAEGLPENAEFFQLTYEDPDRIQHDLAFSAIAPLLWMRAGSQGRRIDKPSADLEIADTYAVLFNVDAAAVFLEQLHKHRTVRCAFVVTDSEAQFQLIVAELPDNVEAVRLYESYLRSVEQKHGED